MNHRPPQSDQQPGRLTWTYTLDLGALSPTEQVEVTWALTGRWWRGRHATIRVGHTRPEALDSRVAYGLAEAIRSGVSLTIDGSPGVVRAWWEALRPTRRCEPARHLHVVR